MAEELNTPTPSQDPGSQPAQPDAPAQPAAPTAAAPAAPPSGDPPAGPAQSQPGTPAEPGQDPSVRAVPAVDEYVLPEGVPKEVAEFAHANQFTQDQLNVVLSEFNKYSEVSREAEAKMIREAGEAHLKTWGDQADFKVRLARQALQQNDPDGSLTRMLNATGYGNHPAVLEFLSRIGTSMQEGGFLKSAVNKPPPKKTAGQLLFGDSMKEN